MMTRARWRPLGVRTTGLTEDFSPPSPAASPQEKDQRHLISEFQPGILLFWQLQNIQISEKRPPFESWHSLTPGH